MLRRLLLAGLAFTAYAGLGGCIVHAQRGPHVYDVTGEHGDHGIDVEVRYHHHDLADAPRDDASTAPASHGPPDHAPAHGYRDTPSGQTRNHGQSKGKNTPED